MKTKLVKQKHEFLGQLKITKEITSANGNS